jgi:hypothetical protein
MLILNDELEGLAPDVGDGGILLSLSNCSHSTIYEKETGLLTQDGIEDSSSKTIAEEFLS